MTCNWGEPNHTYFQIANVFLALTYLVPNTLKGLIVLRLLLCLAGLFFSLWGAIILCAPDTFGWNLVFMSINFIHMAYLLYSTRPITFNEENEVIYGNMFEVLGIKRWQFKPIADLAVQKEYKYGEIIIKENDSICDTLAVITNGTVRVEKSDQLILHIQAYQFLNSPEWVASNHSGSAIPVSYAVSMISEGCILVTWQRSALRRILRQNKILNGIFNSIIGQDVTKKLFKANDAITREYGQTNRSFQTDANELPQEEKHCRSYSDIIYDNAIEKEHSNTPSVVHLSVPKHSNNMPIGENSQLNSNTQEHEYKKNIHSKVDIEVSYLARDEGKVGLITIL